MLEEGFLASTLFYPTTAHSEKHIIKYSDACENVFKIISDIFGNNIKDQVNISVMI